MDTEIQKADSQIHPANEIQLDAENKNKFLKFFKPTPRNILMLSLISFIVIMIVASTCILGLILNQKNIYKGIYINNIYVGNLSPKKATTLLTNKLQNNVSKREITLTCKGDSSVLDFSNINTTYEIEDAVNKAYSLGRTGNVFVKIYDIFKSNFSHKRFDIRVHYDKQKVDNIVNSLYDRTLVKVKGTDLLFKEKTITIHSGHHGENMDKSFALNEIAKLIINCKSGNISIPLLQTPPDKINVDDLYNQINVDVKDAALKIENNKVSISPEVIGRGIDKSQLIKIVSNLDNKEDTDAVLPVSYVYPKVTVDSLNKSLFKDDLYTFWTQYNLNTENNRNRGVNIKLAVSKINNTMLAPGQIFSLNDVVGHRTAELGYLEAITYENGKLVKGVGGGLCQVVSTLYNAVLRSDLQVVQRINHSFIVTYVPLGMDATVSYGEVDFKFKNSTKWPIKILCWTTKDNKLYFSIKGTQENFGKEVEISSTIIKKTPFKVVYIDDPTLPAGTINPVAKQEGHTGYVVDTYKIVKQDGKVISNTRMYTSVYGTLDQEMFRGTKKVAVKPVVQTPQAQKPVATNNANVDTSVDTTEIPATVDNSTTPTPISTPTDSPVVQ